MGFSGCIEDLPIVDLFQYLSIGKKDGTCIFQRKEEKAYVYFHEGNVVHALSPHRVNIGDILIKAQKISLKDLQKALVSQSKSDEKKTIGQILVETGEIESETLGNAVQLQLKEVVLYLVGWTKGDFTFEQNEILPVDDINLNPATVIPKSTQYTTTQLLMEAIGRLDEEKENRSGKVPEPVKVPSALEGKALISENEAVPDEPKPSPGNGSQVSAVEPPAPPQTEERPPVKTEGKENGSESEGGPKDRILLLAGDGIFKHLLREGLQKKGYTVAAISTVEDGLSRVQAYLEEGERFIVLSDNTLPGRRRATQAAGIRFLTACEGSGGKFKVVLMTETEDSGTTEDLYRAGAQAVLLKPVRGTGARPDFPQEVKKFGGLVEEQIRKLSTGTAVR